MADFEEKKDKFSLAINHYAEEQRKKIEQEISEYKKKELEETELQVLTECYQLIQKELAQMRVRISHENALREMESRRKLLQRRTEITSEVFAKVKENLKGVHKAKGISCVSAKDCAAVCKSIRTPRRRDSAESRRREV